MRLKALALAPIALGGSLSASADEFSTGSQVSLLTGYLNSSVRVARLSAQSIKLTGALDGYYERFLTTTSSLLFRVTLAYDISTGLVPYTFFGSGLNFYFNGTGSMYSRSDDGNSVSSSPKRRFFWGPDVGISNLSVTPAEGFSNTTTAVEVGAHLGAVQQLTNTLGLEALLGGSYAVGFSSVSGSAQVLRIFIGLNQFF